MSDSTLRTCIHTFHKYSSRHPSVNVIFLIGSMSRIPTSATTHCEPGSLEEKGNAHCGEIGECR